MPSTRAIRGSRAKASLMSRRVATCAGAVIGAGARTTTSRGVPPPGSNSAAASAVARREGVSAGRMRESGVERRAPRNGHAAPSKTIREVAKTGHGRRVTRDAREDQMPVSVSGRRGRRRNASMRVPMTPRRAGRRVIETTTAPATLASPARPSDRRNAILKATRPPSPARTIPAEKNTARPAVATERVTAASGSAPPSISSR